MNIFYAPRVFSSRRQLLDALPTFGKRLVAYEGALKKRKSVDPDRWWEAVRPRPDLAKPSPRIFTKVFGGPNMAAVDLKGEFLPLQAWAWMPTDATLKVPEGLAGATLQWYCRILNSRIFFLLRRDIAPAVTAGGQLEVAPKYVNDVPLPTPTPEDLVFLALENDPDLSSSPENDLIVAAAYGTRVEDWPFDGPGY